MIVKLGLYIYLIIPYITQLPRNKWRIPFYIFTDIQPRRYDIAMEQTKEIRDHLSAHSHISKKNIIIGNFLGGLAWGVGSVLGATLLLALAGGILQAIGVFDELSTISQNLRR